MSLCDKFYYSFLLWQQNFWVPLELIKKVGQFARALGKNFISSDK